MKNMMAKKMAEKVYAKRMNKGGWVEPEPMQKNVVNPNLMENYEEDENVEPMRMNHENMMNYAEPEYLSAGGMVDDEESDNMFAGDDYYPANLEAEEQAEKGMSYFSAPLNQAKDSDEDRKNFLSRYMAHKAINRNR